MREFLNSWSPRILSVLRIITGFLFLWHGSQKLFDFPHSVMPMSGAFIIFAGSLEFFGGILILIGFFTRPVAFILSGMMAVAYFMGHAFNGKGFLPIENGGNGGELAVIYCFVFFYLFFAGAGPWSIDSLIKKNA